MGARLQCEARDCGMTDYVLVHGAWGGSFGYDRVAADLRAAGFSTITRFGLGS